MRILHVISTLAPHSGGPTLVVRELAAAQDRAGHQVTLCTTNRGNPTRAVLPDEYFAGLDGDHVSVHAFDVDVPAILYSRELVRWIRHNITRFDIVHVHGLYRFPPTYVAAKARRKGVPYIVRPHGSLDPFLYRQSSRSLFLKRAYERWFDFPNLNAAGAIHYTSEEERDHAAPLRLRAPAFVVPNGIDWERFRTPPARGTLRARWGFLSEPIILFLGRLHFKKGLDLLIPAFDLVQQRMPEARLVVAGPENDDYGAQVRGWVRDRGLQAKVHFTGPLNAAEVVQAYVDADVFALPSYTENFGLALAEAMASGLPVVISDQVNIHDEVTRAGAGIVTRCDTGEIATAIVALLNDPDRRRRMGEAGRRLVRERYTWPPIVDALTREYEAVIARHRQSKTERTP